MLSAAVEKEIASKSRNSAKHVSQACLECRSRHMRCSGSQPCSRCERLSKDCTYVKSHRGGSRKKGVSKFNKPKISKTDPSDITPISMSTDTEESRSAIRNALSSTVIASESPSLLGKTYSHNLGYHIPPVEDLITLPCINHKESPNQKRKNYTDLLRMPCAFTCLEPQYRGRTPPCMGGEVRISNNKLNLSLVPFNATSSFYEKVNSNDYMKKMMDSIDVSEVIELYYTNFHKIHPLLPERNEIEKYLDAVPHAYELILAMKTVAEAQSSSLYKSDIETVNFKLNQIFDYINTVVGVDLISLQAMALVSLIAHFSSLHDLSARVRIEAVKALLNQGYNMIDFKDIDASEQQIRDNIAPNSPESDNDDGVKLQRKFLSSERLSKLPEDMIVESARKLFWELHFIDVVIGTADGRTISKLATVDICVDCPHQTSRNVFDYKSRAEACQLVTEAIKLNVSVIDQQLSASMINIMNTSLGNWEMRFNHPELLNAPYMVDTNGNINEGVFQAMLLYNYARIFAHRPFSYLWKDMASDTDEKLGSNKSNANPRKVIETRKTIEGANLIATCLLDTSPTSIHKRTPLYGCSVAFACLVHLSSYIWAKSVLSNLSSDEVAYRRDLEAELRQYQQFIEFELNTLYVISSHWMLANKLASYIKETLSKITPGLYNSIRNAITHVNTRSVPALTVEVESQRDAPQSTRISLNLQLRDMTGTVLSFNSSKQSTQCSTNQSQTATSQRNNENNDYNTNVHNNNTNNSSYSNITSSADEIDFNSYDFSSRNNFYSPRVTGMPESPMSETGCDWIDKNIFEFDGEELTGILDSYDME